MDAAARAELETLRRRAYSSDADITDDPAALDRLAELEDLARTPIVVVDEPSSDISAPTEDSHPPSGPAVALHPPSIPAPPKRSGWHLALVGLTAAAAFVLGATAWAEMRAAPAPLTQVPLDAVAGDALAMATDPDVTVLHILRLDGAAAAYMDPNSSRPPEFPIDEPRWQTALGEYYGYDLWITGTVRLETSAAADQRLCLVLANDSTTRSRCVTRAAWEQGALLLPLTFADLADGDRPEQMLAEQSLGFWWTDDDSVRVLLGRVG